MNHSAVGRRSMMPATASGTRPRSTAASTNPKITAPTWATGSFGSANATASSGPIASDAASTANIASTSLALSERLARRRTASTAAAEAATITGAAA